MKKIAIFLSVAMLVMSCGYNYETVKGDPLETKIYTLDNGLKIYMSVNKDEPRLQTAIAVRVGGKNDPAEATGMAHYFEHLMFKGTQKFGTSDYAAEKVYLDRIEELFETYRHTTDDAARKAIYHEIDSLSYLASQIAIPNEYDKLMATIGADGTNAFTSTDVTCYVEDIPSNQIENWARIQADRFENAVIRGFHTELETIYEEKNMSLTQDSNKVWEAVDEALFPFHPYGRQTVLGTQEHLKNPSITLVKKYHDTFYVPNNMVVCVAGDFDPDYMVSVIKKYFGHMKPNPAIPAVVADPETPITEPVVRNIYGLESENVTLAWRTPGQHLGSSAVGNVAASILYNGMCGLVDVDLVDSQKVLNMWAFLNEQPDYSSFMAQGRPKAGQSLEEVRDLFLAVVEKLRAGDFDEELVKASVNNILAQSQGQLESNYGRASQFIDSFVAGLDWKQTVGYTDELKKVTKADVVEWANTYLRDDNYACVFKRQGEDTTIKKISAPAITPIATNRDAVSDFVKEIQATEVKPIEPVFVDFEKDLTRRALSKGTELLYAHKSVNDLYTLSYYFNKGTQDCPALALAGEYFNLLGTAEKSSLDIKSELYELASEVSFHAGAHTSSVTITGLRENMPQAIAIAEDLILNAVGDEEIFSEIKAQRKTQRSNSKLQQRACFGALSRYAQYGADVVKKNTLSNAELDALTSEDVLGAARSLMNEGSYVLYYGKDDAATVAKEVLAGHAITDAARPEYVTDIMRETSKPVIYLAQYDSPQLYYRQFSCDGAKYNAALEPAVTLYNEYFGGGMNGIVFQEMREARGLAYSASAYYSEPYSKEQPYSFGAFIATQNDKMQQAIEAFDDIINNMPESEAAFKIAKEGLISRLRTARTSGFAVINKYIECEELGIEEPTDKALYEAVQNMTLEDVKAFQQEYVKGRTYNYAILGDIKNLDLKYLGTLGTIKVLSSTDIFGY